MNGFQYEIVDVDSFSGSLGKVFTDGCFDLTNFGHANAFIRISSVSRELFVGLHSNDDILENKGLPIYNLDERCKIVEQMKGVDGVIVSPYKFDLKYIEKYNLDYVMHGSDYNVVYDEAVRAKKYKSFARTLSISSTNILIRLISMAKAEMNKTMDLEPIDFSTMSDSLPDNEVMARFFKNSNKAQPDHIDLLEKASKYGVKDEDKKNFLIVGVLSSTNGLKYSKDHIIQTLEERVLMLSSSKFVDKVVVNAPLTISEKSLDILNADLVLCRDLDYKQNRNVFEVPSSKNILHIIPNSELKMTKKTILDRIISNMEILESKIGRKLENESDFI